MSHTVERDPRRLFAPIAVEVERRADGATLVQSGYTLGTIRRALGEALEEWAEKRPDVPFVLERDSQGAWRGPTYREAQKEVWRLASALIEMGLGLERPIMILSENGVGHALLTLAAMHVGIPVVPVSTAYSLMSTDHAKLAAIVARMKPGLIYAADSKRYGPALAALEGDHGAVVISDDGGQGRTLATLGGLEEDPRVRAAYRALTGETIAKLLLTSGSTGEPKAVINTQRMLCTGQRQRELLWPFLDLTPPVMVDWLPWNHTFGANHNFNMVLAKGGTLYIDRGRPVPGLFDETVRTLREISPTVYLNVPRGFEMLVAALKEDPALRKSFFARLQLMFYAAAALPQHLWEELTRLAIEELGTPVAMVSAWGSTETAPLAADCHFQADRSGVIGLPVPGVTLKLVPNGDKKEIRVRGDNVTPGYWQRPDLTATAFDEEGFYKIGDAVTWRDADDPRKGLVFDGRVAEDFKLSSGTWVNVGALRLAALGALAPLAQDIVVCGHDRAEIGLLIFPNLVVARKMASAAAEEQARDVLAHPSIRERVQRGLAELAARGGGSSTFATRALLLEEPASIDAGEITDKAYINQRAVLSRREALVQKLYEEDPGYGVILLPQ